MNRLQIVEFNDKPQSVAYGAAKHATHKPI